MSATKSYNELPIYLDLVKLLQNLMEYKNNWQKEDRVVFYQPLALLIKDTIKLFFDAQNSVMPSDRLLILKKISCNISEIGFNFDLIKNVNVISFKQFSNLSKILGCIQKQCTGYINYMNKNNS